jgi:hypothetical protein
VISLRKLAQTRTFLGKNLTSTFNGITGRRCQELGSFGLAHLSIHSQRFSRTALSKPRFVAALTRRFGGDFARASPNRTTRSLENTEQHDLHRPRIISLIFIPEDRASVCDFEPSTL